MVRILVVDDDEAVRRLAAMILAAAGYEVLEADGPAAAVRHCEEEIRPIHLVLADVVMPQLSGRQLATQIAALRPDVKILLMSGYPNVFGLLNGIATRAEKIQAECNFLRKPFTPTELVAKVRGLLATEVYAAS